jgi:dCTP deaminase
MRLADEFKVFTNVYNSIVDPKNMPQDSYVEMSGSTCIIPPNSFMLGRSIEHFKIPIDVWVICLGKSTYARCGISVNITPMEPGWAGHLTIEISNLTPLPVRVYANEGIAQASFFQGDEPCEVSYADRSGKYQNQVGVQVAKV